MNTGIGDAVDIGWKLAAVLQGWGGPHLLASYEIERKLVLVRPDGHVAWREDACPDNASALIDRVRGAGSA